MGKITAPSIRRLNELTKRQGQPAFGDRYQAGIRATREEGPSRSELSEIHAPKLGRKLQALSGVEADIFTMTMERANVVEVLDQFVLPTVPHTNWLAQPPFAVRGVPAKIRGTVTIAAELGVLPMHPTVNDPTEGTIAFPWIGDALVFFKVEDQYQAVSLNIKAKHSDFYTDFPRDRRARDLDTETSRPEFRHRIEEMLLQEAGARTIRVTQEDYSPSHARNVRWAHLAALGPVPLLTEKGRAFAIERFQSAAINGKPPIQVQQELHSRLDIHAEVSKAVLARALLDGVLPVDMTRSHILMDLPLPYCANPEERLPSWLKF